MIRFFDTSALVKRYVDEPGSGMVRAAIRTHAAVVVRVTLAEAAAAIARAARGREVDARGGDAARGGEPVKAARRMKSDRRGDAGLAMAALGVALLGSAAAGCHGDASAGTPLPLEGTSKPAAGPEARGRVEIDPALVTEARARMPSLQHGRRFEMFEPMAETPYLHLVPDPK